MRIKRGSEAISLHSAVDRYMKGKRAALAEPGQHHVFAAAQELRFFINQVTNNLCEEQTELAADLHQ
jgi:hypothetical protein